MIAPLKVLFIAAECAPFYAVGGLADVIGSLPRALRALGHDVRVALPRYKSIDGAKFGLTRASTPFTAYAGREERRTEMLRSDATGVPTYFVWDERFFNRATVYGQPDEVMAFAFFARAMIEYLRIDGWLPDVVHVHDWHAAAALAWLDTVGRSDPRFAPVASVLTIHNIAYQGVTGDAIWAFAGLPEHRQHLAGEKPGTVNWMARGIAHADALNAVSPRYARDILKPEYGAGLDALVRQRRSRLIGILNGIDSDAWNPATDAALAARFDAGSLDKRARNKRALQAALHLPRNGAPLMGLSARLVESQGIDLVLKVMEDVTARGVQFAMLGAGDALYESAFRDLAAQHLKQVAFASTADDGLLRLLCGGSDIMLFPSRHEPDGTSQLKALHYGAIPVTHAVGGLADSVIDATRHASGTGFSFGPHTARALLGALDRALEARRSERRWRAIQARAMAVNVSWDNAARQYEGLYRKAVQLRRARSTKPARRP